MRCATTSGIGLKDILPGREGHVGGTAADNRLFVEAVLFRFRAGIPWRDLPERFGDWKIVYQRFNRWAKSGVFEGVFRLLASDHDSEYMMIGCVARTVDDDAKMEIRADPACRYAAISKRLATKAA